MAKYTHVQEILDFHGIDLRSSDLIRPRGFSMSGSKNFQHSPQGALQTRKGSKLITSGFGKVGLIRFDTTSMTGVSKTEVIGFGQDSITNSALPYRLVKGSFVLTNSHASLAATVSHYYDTATSQFRFKIVRSTTLIDQALGLGTEGSPYMLSSLETAVDALTSFSMSTPTNASSTPAAFMEIIADTSIPANGGTLTVYYYYWEAITAQMGTGSAYATLKNVMLDVGSSDFSNLSAAVVRGVLYMSAGKVWAATGPGGSLVQTAIMTKYDGQAFYRAGWGNADIKVTQVVGSSGAATGSQTDSKGTFNRSSTITGAYSYFGTLIRVDKVGNRIESNELANGRLPVEYSAQVGVVTANDFSAMANGYGYRSAQVNGTMSGTLTLTVDNPHTMVAGEIAYFWDSAQSRFIQREVTAVTSTTITLSSSSLDSNSISINYDVGGNVSTNDNAFITNNFRVAIWRTKANGQAYYLESERPYRTGAIAEYDTTADSALGAEFVSPVYPHDEPPAGKYLCSYNDQLIVSGDKRKANTVMFSDETPEYFPKGSHEFDLPGEVTGIQQTGEVLACGTYNSLHVVTGDLLNINFRVDRIGNNIGVTSHHAMREAMEGVLMFPSYKGPHVLVNGRDLRPLGEMKLADNSVASRLMPYFTRKYGPTEDKPMFERCIAAVLPNDNLYVLFVPIESPSVPGFATSSSQVFAYDYSRDAWYQWDGLNMAGGMCVLEDQLMFTSRSYDGSGGPIYSDIVCRLSQQQKLKGKYDYADHDAAISFVDKESWEAFGQPSLFKRFLRIRVFSHETRDVSSMPVTITTYVDYDDTAESFTDTMTFTTQKGIKMKVKGEVCRSMMFKFSNSTIYSPVLISGYELEGVANFRPEFKE